MEAQNKIMAEEKLVDTSTCQMRKLSGKVTVCMTERICPFGFSYGHLMLCKHPVFEQIIAAGALPEAN